MTENNAAPPPGKPAEIYRQAMHACKTAYIDTSSVSLDLMSELADLAKDGPVSRSDMKAILTRYIARYKDVNASFNKSMDGIVGLSDDE